MKSLRRFVQLLDQIEGINIVVIGDIILDEYTFGDAGKVSTGIQIPIIEKTKQIYNLGGAGNVAGNMAALSKNVSLIGQIGSDRLGNHVEELIRNQNIALYKTSSETTIVKQRIYVSDQQIMRLDNNSYIERLEFDFDTVLVDIKPDVIVLVDYGYGMVSQSVIDMVCDYGKENKVVTIMSSRDYTKYQISRIDLIVANENEVNECNDIFKNVHHMYITHGEKGIGYLEEKEEIFFKQSKRMPVNVSGAGDTALAIIALLSRTDAVVPEILEIANLAAGIAVEDQFTYVINKKEMINAMYNNLVDEDPSLKILSENEMKILVEAWKQNSYKIVFTNGCYDILHYGHFSLLSAAKEYGDRLIVAINSDSSVKRIKGKDRPINDLNTRIKTLACLEMVDALVSFDTDTAIELIKIIKPDIYVKGDEYKSKELPEADYVDRVELIPMIDGFSTTNQIKKIQGEEK